MKQFLKKLYRYWIRFGHVLGTVNAYLIMTLVYFVVIGPISLMLKLFRVDVLHRRRPTETNWHPLALPPDELEAYKRLS